MSKEEFLRQLEHELRSLSKEERNNAMQFYRDYLNDADDVQQAIDHLGSPQKVASDILREVGSVPSNARTNRSNGKSGFWSGLDKGQKILLVCLIIFASITLLPLSIGGLGLALGVAVAIIAVIFCLFLVFFVLGIVFTALGIVGIVMIFSAAISAADIVALLGIILIFASLAVLCFSAFVWLCKAIVPKAVRGIVNILQKIFYGIVNFFKKLFHMNKGESK